jgi:hypothetical protein
MSALSNSFSFSCGMAPPGSAAKRRNARGLDSARSHPNSLYWAPNPLQGTELIWLARLEAKPYFPAEAGNVFSLM